MRANSLRALRARCVRDLRIAVRPRAQLPSIFLAGCYEVSGSHVISLVDMNEQNETNHKTIRDQKGEIASYTRNLATCSDDLNDVKTELKILNATCSDCDGDSKCNGIDNNLAIALIVVMGAMFFIVLVILGLLISK